MAEYRKSGSFAGKRPGGFRPGGERPRFANKSHFGGSRGRDESRPQMHAATCAQCRKACEVPFRPNGERPVFCKDCFANGRDEPQGARTFVRRDERTPSPYTPKPQAPERQSDELKVQLVAMNRKLDSVVLALESLTRAISAPTPEAKPVAAKVVKKSAPKKVRAK